LTYMLHDEFRLLFRLFLNKSSLVRDGYLNGAPIKKILEEHISHKADNGNRLWLLCNAEVWYRMFIEGQNRNSLKEYIRQGAASLNSELNKK